MSQGVIDITITLVNYIFVRSLCMNVKEGYAFFKVNINYQSGCSLDRCR